VILRNRADDLDVVVRFLGRREDGGEVEAVGLPVVDRVVPISSRASSATMNR
jgi:hypothetical protein